MISKVFVTAMVALALIGCTTIKGHPDRTNDVSQDLENLEQYFSAEKLKEYDDATGVTKKIKRDEIVNGRLAAMDLQYGIFQQSLYRSGVGLNIGTDVVTLGLGAAGSIFSGGTSQILSAASAGTIGLKESVDKNLFFERTMPALLAQMAAQRKTVLARIRIGLSESIQDYPLNQALVDLEDYYIAGTIPGAITGILEASGEKSAEAQGLLNTLTITSETVSDETKAKRESLRDQIDALAADKAIALMKDARTAYPELGSFIDGQDPANKRFTDLSGQTAKTILKRMVTISGTGKENTDKWQGLIDKHK